MSVRLSILDQSPIIGGQTPAAAIHATLELAEAADRLGYHRYWLAEHHAMKGLADPCPEILLGQIGARTQRIRITGAALLLFIEEAVKHIARIDLGGNWLSGGTKTAV